MPSIPGPLTALALLAAYPIQLARAQLVRRTGFQAYEVVGCALPFPVVSRHTSDGLTTVTRLALARGDLLDPAEALIEVVTESNAPESVGTDDERLKRELGNARFRDRMVAERAWSRIDDEPDQIPQSPAAQRPVEIVVGDERHPGTALCLGGYWALGVRAGSSRVTVIGRQDCPQEIRLAPAADLTPYANGIPALVLRLARRAAG